MGRAAEVVAPSSSIRTDGGCPVVQVNDLSRSLAAFDPISTSSIEKTRAERLERATGYRAACTVRSLSPMPRRGWPRVP